MNYIIFDLEWNQSPEGKSGSDERMPFEIIEIGAVRLNEKREKTGEFQTLIKPQVYKWIHDSIHSVVHVDYKDLMNGVPFPQAIRHFSGLVREDFVFCTWGMQDLTELQRNLKYYDLLELLPGPVTYYDIQKLFQLVSRKYEAAKGAGICSRYPGNQKGKGISQSFGGCRIYG